MSDLFWLSDAQMVRLAPYFPKSQGQGARWDFGIHRAIGGDHDQPNPGDMLCAALAAWGKDLMR